MTTERDPGLLLATWLDEGPRDLPSETRRAIETAVRTMPQRRRGFGRSWRFPSMRLSLRPVVVICLVLALGAGLALFAGSARPVVVPSLPPSVAPEPSPQASSAPVASYAAIFVRRDDGKPGLTIYAVGADGAERLLGSVEDSALPQKGHVLGEFGRVSEDGWLAVEDPGGKPGPKHVVVVDLKHPAADPWVVPDAFGCCPAPVWGPTSLLAALSEAEPGQQLVVADPVARTRKNVAVRVFTLPGILWTADGGLIDHWFDSPFTTRYVDGRLDAPGVQRLFGNRSAVGPDGSTLTVCDTASEPCPARAEGVRLHTLNGTLSDVHVPPIGDDTVVAASFGSEDGEYWLFLQHDGGRQIRVVDLTASGLHDVATIDATVKQTTVGAGPIAPDDSVVSAALPGESNTPYWVLVPTGGGSPSFHTGDLAGFVKESTLSGDALPGTTAPTASSP